MSDLKKLRYKSASMCVSSDWCRGYNEAVDDARQHIEELDEAMAERAQVIQRYEKHNVDLIKAKTAMKQRIEELERNATTLPEYVGALRLLQRQLDEALLLIERVIECYEDGIMGDTPSSGLVVMMKNLLESGAVRIREMKDEADR